jgi:diguanylate cyclase (GGDEF)-like protein
MSGGDGATEEDRLEPGPAPTSPRLRRPVGDAGRATLHVSLVAARGLLRAGTPEDVAEVVASAVRELGGELEPPASRSDGQLPLDVSFGTSDPLVPAGDPTTLDLLRVAVPAIVEDAHAALGRIRREGHLAATAGTDVLTGVADRRVGMRVLGRVEEGDVVAMVDLDHFKDVNDRLGHLAGDEVLRSFGGALRHGLRAADTAARLGGEEFLLLLPRTTVSGAQALLERLRARWVDERPQPISFSAGLAAVGPDGGRAALAAADRALYAAKGAGRDRVEIAP